MIWVGDMPRDMLMNIESTARNSWHFWHALAHNLRTWFFFVAWYHSPIEQMSLNTTYLKPTEYICLQPDHSVLKRADFGSGVLQINKHVFMHKYMILPIENPQLLRGCRRLSASGSSSFFSAATAGLANCHGRRWNATDVVLQGRVRRKEVGWWWMCLMSPC